MNTFLRPYNPKDFENHTYFTRHLILLLLAISSTVPVGTLMGSGMLLDNYAEMTRAAFRLINPLCGQSRN